MSYRLGTIEVKTEFRQEPEIKIESLQDITIKYGSLGREPKEHLYAVFLNGRNEEIGDKLIGLGRNNAVQFDVPDIARTAILVNAVAVILVHNHPSGNNQPTEGDIEIAGEIHDLLDQLGLELLDHVIVSRNGSHSMRGNSDGPFRKEVDSE